MPKKQKSNSPISEFIQNTENTIARNIQTLKSQLELHSNKYQVQCQCIKYDNAKMFFKWASEFYENFELLMQGNRPYHQPHPNELYFRSDELLILKSFNLNSSINDQMWEPVILPSFGLSASKGSEDERRNILKTIIKLIGGYFNDSKVIEQIRGDLIEFRTIKVEDSEKWILLP